VVLSYDQPMQLPEQGRPSEEIFAEMEALAANDKDFAAGRTFGLVYHAGHDVEEVARRAHDRFVWHNALNPDVKPSMRDMSRTVIGTTAWLLSGGTVGDGAVSGELAGFMTSGGTESILMGVKAAKVRAKNERGTDHPNIVLPTSAHAAFAKASDYFGIEPRRIDVLDDYRADVDAMADAVDDDTVLIVGSAPQYPQGVVDPIPDLAAIALERGINCHVDACMGGFTLPFLERAGLIDEPWDFRVPGVTSISADLHKYGFVPKGASVIMHRDKSLRRNQTFVFDGWLGGFYASSGILGTKPGGPIAASYATMQYLGVEGYVEKASQAFRARERLVDAVRQIPGLIVLGEPEVTLCAITGEPGVVDAFQLGDELSARGWHLDRQAPPDSLHASCAPVHDTGTVLDEFLTDLRDALRAIGAARAEDRGTNYAVME
jgi:sphinganine-1-phosphate aldolase